MLTKSDVGFFVITTLAVAGYFLFMSWQADRFANHSLQLFQRYPRFLQRALRLITRNAASTKSYYFWQFRIVGAIAALTALAATIAGVIFVLR